MTKPTRTLQPPRPAGIRRRGLLGLSGAAAAAAAFGTASLGGLFAPRRAWAADYKALVCVFLYGGNDGMNTVVPTDATRHASYAGVRGRLALPRGSLVPLAGSDYGLHPAMAALRPAWAAGSLAPVFNVGPLYAPLTKAQFLAEPDSSDLIPDNLFSHSDQQLLWESSRTDATTRVGWGGMASEVLATANPVISVGGNGRFGVGSLATPLVLPGPGDTFGAYTLQDDDIRNWPVLAQRKAAVQALVDAAQQDSDLGLAFASQQRAAFEVSARLAGVIARTPTVGGTDAIDQAFAPITTDGQITSGLGQQMYLVARLIEANATVQGNRQIFMAQLGGFDTHGDQVGDDVLQGQHADLLGELADALAAFQAAMAAIGMADQVTAFTQSDFGRTFAPNNSAGTDHAWGNHHLVLGGAVRGGTTYGRYPELALGGPDDVGVQAWERHGRWIPGLAVDQYAATLLAWFGADAGQLDAVLPNLRNFGSARSIGFV